MPASLHWHLPGTIASRVVRVGIRSVLTSPQQPVGTSRASSGPKLLMEASVICCRRRLLTSSAYYLVKVLAVAEPHVINGASVSLGLLIGKSSPRTVMTFLEESPDAPVITSLREFQTVGQLKKSLGVNMPPEPKRVVPFLGYEWQEHKSYRLESSPSSKMLTRSWTGDSQGIG